MNFDELFAYINYLPHPAQRRFHQSVARFKVLVAGARFGKSLAAANDNLPEMMGGDTNGWLVGPTRGLTRPEFDYLRADVEHALRCAITLLSDPAGLRAPWAAELERLSAHMPHTLLGREIDWLILCEAAHMKRADFERYLRARLATRMGRCVIPTTPRGRNWVEGLYQRGLEHAPGWASFRHASWENPLLPPAEVESARACLPQETFDEQYGGAFTSPSGRVYREFQPAQHVAALPAPAGSIIYKAIDVGYTSPLACLWATLDSDGRVLILREHYVAGVPMPVHAQTILAIDGEFEACGCLIGPAWVDPAAAGEARILSDAGIRCQRADNDVHGGIAVVRGRLLARADGRPGLQIDPCCKNLLRELESYEWEDSSRPGERVPRKRDDHALDALRYLCVALGRRVDWQKPATLW